MRFLPLILTCLSNLILGASGAHAETSLCQQANLSSFVVHTYSGKFANSDQDYCQLPAGRIPSEIKLTLQTILTLENRISKFIEQTYFLKIERLTSKPIEISLQGNIAGSLDSISSFPSLSLGVFKDWSGEPLDASGFIHEFTHLLLNDPIPIVPVNLIKFAKLPLFSEQLPDTFALALTQKSFAGTGLPSCAGRAMHGDDHSRSFQLPLENFSTHHWIPEMLACCAREKINEPKNHHFVEFCQVTKNFSTGGKSCSFSSSGKAQGCSAHAISIPVTSFLNELNASMVHPDFKFYFKAFKNAANTAQLFRRVRATLDLADQIRFDQLWVEFKMDTALAIASAEERDFPAAAN